MFGARVFANVFAAESEEVAALLALDVDRSEASPRIEGDASPFSSRDVDPRQKVRIPVNRWLCVASGRDEPAISASPSVANIFSNVKHGPMQSD